MAELIPASDCSHAWLLAAERLQRCGGDCFNLIVEIENPNAQHTGVRELLDSFLSTSGKKPIDEVANTIFPESLYSPSLGRSHLYQSYDAAWPMVRLFNGSGTYFRRMTHLAIGTQQVNQLETTIHKLREAQLGARAYRSRYEVGIYQPMVDGSRQRGFPCLSHLSFKLYQGRLHLTALYRNQYYIERAYGNFLGLGRLLGFVAEESKLVAGRLTCLSTHAELDGAKSSVASLLRSCFEASGVCP